jgi:hypothetical protein
MVVVWVQQRAFLIQRTQLGLLPTCRDAMSPLMWELRRHCLFRIYPRIQCVCVCVCVRARARVWVWVWVWVWVCVCECVCVFCVLGLIPNSKKQHAYSLSKRLALSTRF